VLHGKSSMFQVWERLMSGNRKDIVRFDFDRAVTRRYDRSEMEAEIAACATC
jgi:uncharacterized protein (UPF0297 family)